MTGRRRKPWVVRTVAAVVALLLVSLSIAAALNLGEDKAEGLAPAFAKVDQADQAQTQQFIQETKDLEKPDLRTSLRLFGVALDAAQDAQDGYEELDVLDSMEDARTRVVKALEVQIRALESAITAARNQDATGANDATRQVQAAALGYQAARARLATLIETCGERCA